MIGPIEQAVENMVRRSQKNLNPGDYVKNGVYHCGKCRTPKQCKITTMGREFLPFFHCKCQKERYDAERQRIAESERLEKIRKMRRSGIPIDMRGFTFENDIGLCPALIEKSKRYVDSWERMRKENIGVMFWGSLGNGKTYAATCIANKLIDNGTSAKVTSIPALLNDLSGFLVEDKNEYIANLSRYSLLVIDDLGAERDTEYALEKVYQVIDERYRCGKPLIVTTNLSLEELKSPNKIEYERIYSRVLEMCVPIKCTEPSVRPLLAKDKFTAVKRFLEEENEK